MNQKTTQILLNTSVALFKFAKKSEHKRGLSSFYDVRPKTKLESFWEQIKVFTSAFVGLATVGGGLAYIVHSTRRSDEGNNETPSLQERWKEEKILEGPIRKLRSVLYLREYGFLEQTRVLNPNQFEKFPLKEVIPVNHNTNIYRFGLPKDKSLGLPTASCILTKGPEDATGKPIIRPYTPITPGGHHGYFDLLVKTYPQGNMSKYIQSLKVGQTLEVKGPIKKIEYHANMKHKIGMIAGGTGLTPMLQIIQDALSNPFDKTEVTLLFANIAEEDILLKKNLDALAKQYPNFKVHYVLEKPPKNWNGSVGYVTDDIIKRQLPPPAADTMIMVCGPPPMMKAISGDKTPDNGQGELSGALKRLGYSEDQVFKF